MTMRLRTASISLLAALVLTGCSALSPAPDRTLTVTGSGTTKVTPDVVSVTLGIQTRNDDVAQAVAENNVVAGRIMDASRSIGVADADMRTIYFSVSSQPKYDEFGSPTGEVSFFVDNSLQVTLRDVSKLSDLLQTAIDAGANSIYGVNFSVADTKAAEDEARHKAVADAQARATELAGVAGVTLGAIQTVTTNFSAVPIPYYGMAADGMGGGGGPPTQPGSLEVSVQVTIIYNVR
jgi:uncharacterized protein YggE